MQAAGVVGLGDENIGEELGPFGNNGESADEPARADAALEHIATRRARVQANGQVALLGRYVEFGGPQPTLGTLHADRVYEIEKRERLIASVAVLY